MEQIMNLTLRAVGGTLVALMDDFAYQLAALVDGRPETVVSIEGIGRITRNLSGDGGAFECTRTYSISLGENYPPTAEYATTVTGLSVQFDGNYSSDIDGTITEYVWDFGDGETSVLLQPIHAYATAGTYTVVLTVTDNDGATGTITKQVTVAPVNVGPTAEFASTATGLSVQFDGNYSTDSDGTIASTVWDFGDGESSTELQPIHVYAAAGTYPTTLTVTDNQGGAGTITKDTTVTS